jgi:hypothetical protein
MTPLFAPARGLRTLHFGVVFDRAQSPSGILVRGALANYTVPVGKRVVRAHTTTADMETAASTPWVDRAAYSGTA